MNDKAVSGGYYSVNLGEGKAPYIVFARSDWHAAKLAQEETGYRPREHEVKGPY